MRDLNEVAAGNAAALERDSRSLIDNDPAGVVARFHRLASESDFSTNVLPHKVLAFDHHGELLDGRRISTYFAGGDQAAGIAGFENSQPADRLRFEAMWEHGDRFLYGAANAGGLGATDFGGICLVVDPLSPSPEALAVFPGDSVKLYASTDTLDQDRAEQEAAPWQHRGDVAVIKLGARAQALPESEWPELLCNRTDYLEVVRAGRLPLARLGQIRLPQQLWDEWQELRTRMDNGDELTRDEQRGVQALEALERWHTDFGSGIQFESPEEDAAEA